VSPPVYFDTSVFLAILKPESSAKKIRALMKELEDENVRIYTSILTLQEASVLGFRRGTVAKDNVTRIGKIARIIGINPDIALTAAKLEAHLSDKASESEQDRSDKKRRKWDCFHIATAQAYKCSVLYAEDIPMQRRQSQLGIVALKISAPRAKMDTLDFDTKVPKKKGSNGKNVKESNTPKTVAENPSPVQGNDTGRVKSEAAREGQEHDQET
jgi:predicted nucleic acid-binding protein